MDEQKNLKNHILPVNAILSPPLMATNHPPLSPKKSDTLI